MNEDELDRGIAKFWAIIDQIKGDNIYADDKALAGAVSNMSNADLRDFGVGYVWTLDECFSYDIMAVAQIIVGIVSDSKFDVQFRRFCAWLMSTGSHNFAAVLADPNYVLDIVGSVEAMIADPDYPFKDIFLSNVYQSKLFDFLQDEFSKRGISPKHIPESYLKDAPSGVPFDDDERPIDRFRDFYENYQAMNMSNMKWAFKNMFLCLVPTVVLILFVWYYLRPEFKAALSKLLE